MAEEKHPELARRFSRDMDRGVAELTALGYDPKIFRMMLTEHGAVEAARRLIRDTKPSYGLWELQKLNRLDTSVEMWVLLPWYEQLFDQHTRDQAERKLKLLGVDVDRELRQLVARLQPEA
jgi:hypothetical protein